MTTLFRGLEVFCRELGGTCELNAEQHAECGELFHKLSSFLFLLMSILGWNGSSAFVELEQIGAVLHVPQVGF